MSQTSSAEFLKQAYANNWQSYLASLQPAYPHTWDICVLTAGDEHQAAMCRRQLERRREEGLLPTHTSFLVVSDPDGRRNGSGTAILRVLAKLKAEFPLSGSSRILIIQSGGDSRRLPQYSVIGKLFARLPRELPDGRASTLFDEFLISLSGLVGELEPGVLIASGDVLLIFDRLQLSLRRRGVTGVTTSASVEMGMQHGVYARYSGSQRIRAYLHKPTLNQMQQWEVLAPDGNVQVDTGLVWLDAQATWLFTALTEHESIARICDPRANDGPTDGTSATSESTLNFYGDLLLPLAESTQLSSYLTDATDGPASPDAQAARKVLWERLRGLSFNTEQLQPAMFAHFGSSQEYWQTLAGDTVLREVCGWTTRTSSWPEKTGSDRLILINSALDDDTDDTDIAADFTQPVLLIDSHVSGRLICQGAAMIANTCARVPISLLPDTVVHQTVLKNGFVTRVYGMRDDPKRAIDAATGSFMNRPWSEWLTQAQLHKNPAVLWPESDGLQPAERALWNARLYPVCANRDDSLRLSLLLQTPSALAAQAEWLASPRMSLRESFACADNDAVLQDISAVEDLVAAHRFYTAILRETPAAQAGKKLGVMKSSILRRSELVSEWLERQDPVAQLRSYQALAVASGQPRYQERAFATLATLVRSRQSRQAGAEEPPSGRGGGAKRERRGQRVRVDAAARIDFGGGWTDTPPYSIERGGTVLNAALLLRDPRSQELRHPITAEAIMLDEPRLVIEGLDIEMSIEPEYCGELLAYANPADPFALHKAALVMREIVPGNTDPHRPVADLMREIGYGIQVKTQTFIPRGSGLGTSSILAGALLACLGQITGNPASQEQLYDEVLALEQMLTTGGGWQDQVGGLLGGIKLVTSEPGFPQIIRAQPLHLSAQTTEELANRLLLVYTGQQRLAKNLLRMMVTKWMSREPHVAQSLHEIAHLAREMSLALQAGDINSFGELVGRHWQINKRMDPGCTNPFIDRLFTLAQPYINGGKLSGAGGGGFAIMIARSIESRLDLDALLASRYQDTPVAIWDCAVPEAGMTSTNKSIKSSR